MLCDPSFTASGSSLVSLLLSQSACHTCSLVSTLVRTRCYTGEHGHALIFRPVCYALGTLYLGLGTSADSSHGMNTPIFGHRSGESMDR
ncbi:hypothetical protein BU25DRAFT_102675 [Macroventuria anomochaeta]|uniref:Uncharacterized protein n=1 Tax=Macroventuria anomochaeta TaxID=301207 RepID=A0ACB6RY31_9PLEO|nr:uncharacterized protein BU25DRAFT_102675 [Macroventuria anomochaeta]KAF2626172.1 hypothetical protein BU25DRAFT_102675 [Macroventuria anomochaeta]